MRKCFEETGMNRVKGKILVNMSQPSHPEPAFKDKTNINSIRVLVNYARFVEIALSAIRNI